MSEKGQERMSVREREEEREKQITKLLSANAELFNFLTYMNIVEDAPQQPSTLTTTKNSQNHQQNQIQRRSTRYNVARNIVDKMYSVNRMKSA